MALWLMARFNQGDFGVTGSVTGWRSHQGCLVEYRFMMIYDLCVIKLMRSVTGFGKGNMELMNSVFIVFFKGFLSMFVPDPAVPDITGSLHRHSDAWCKTAWQGCSSFRSDVDMIAIKKALIHWIFS